MIEDTFSELDHLGRAKMDRPVEVEALIRKLGITLLHKTMDEKQSGYLKHELDGSFTIAINNSEGIQRQRFTAAHELGHYFMHRDLIKPGERHADRLFDGAVNPEGPLDKTHESQANKFAAETLMPSSEIKRLYDPLTGYQQLASEFGVSPKAMAWRLVNLRLATKRELGLG